jgi:acyl dehydratase
MYFDELVLGMSVKTDSVVIEKEKMMAFAYEYDNIPLHTDEEYASKTHFGKLIAPGVMSFMSVWAKYQEVDFFGEALLAGRSTKIEWLKPVFAGDALYGEAKITKLTRRNSKNGLVEITIEVYNDKKELVMVNRSEAVVKCKNVEEKNGI